MATPQRQAAAAVGHGAAAGCGAAAGDDMDGLVGMVLGGCIKEELGGYDLQSQTRPLEESRRMSIFLLTKGVQCSDIWFVVLAILYIVPSSVGCTSNKVLDFFGHAWFRGQQCWMGMCFICVFGISLSS